MTLKHECRGVCGLEGGRLLSKANGYMRVWDPATGVTVATMVGKCGVTVAALPGGRFAAAGYTTNKVEVWDPASPARPICEYTGHAAAVICVASLPGNLVASASFDSTVHIWRADTGAHVATLQGHTGYVHALAVLSDGRLASGSWDKTVRLWDVSHPASSSRVLTHGDLVLALAVLDGGLLASGCWDNKVYLWDLKSVSDKPMALLGEHTDGVVSLADGGIEAKSPHSFLCLAALPRGLLASGSVDKVVRIWNVAARTCVAVLQGHSRHVWAMAALPDGRLASGCRNNEVRVWELHPIAPAPPTVAAQAPHGPPHTDLLACCLYCGGWGLLACCTSCGGWGVDLVTYRGMCRHCERKPILTCARGPPRGPLSEGDLEPRAAAAEFEGEAEEELRREEEGGSESSGLYNSDYSDF